MRKFHVLFSAFAVLLASILYSAPVDSSLGSDGCSREEETRENLWVWPTQAAPIRYCSPSTVWNPEIGMWHTRIAVNGYNQNAKKRMATFTENSVSCGYEYGYGGGCFLMLPPGDYTMECQTDGRAKFSVTWYEQVEGGFKYVKYKTFQKQETEGGPYSIAFVVTEDFPLVMIHFTNWDANAEWITTTDINLYRED